MAIGELTWTQRRWEIATLPEFNTALEGYWKNWERNTAWLMREIVFELISGNPYLKGTKPSSSKEIYKLKDDIVKTDKTSKRVNPEELEEVRKKLIGLRDIKK